MDKPDIAVVVLCLLGIATVFFLSFRDSFDIFCLSTCTTFFLFIFLAGHLNEDFAVRKITKRSSVSKALMWTGILLALFTIIQTSNSGEYSPWQSVGCYSSLILILIPWLVLASKEDILKIEERERKKREWNGGLSPSSNIRTWRKLSKEELDDILKHRGWNRGGTADEKIKRLRSVSFEEKERYESMPVDELRLLCEQKNLGTSGGKNRLVSRLTDPKARKVGKKRSDPVKPGSIRIRAGAYEDTQPGGSLSASGPLGRGTEHGDLVEKYAKIEFKNRPESWHGSLEENLDKFWIDPNRYLGDWGTVDERGAPVKWPGFTEASFTGSILKERTEEKIRELKNDDMRESVVKDLVNLHTWAVEDYPVVVLLVDALSDKDILVREGAKEVLETIGHDVE